MILLGFKRFGSGSVKKITDPDPIRGVKEKNGIFFEYFFTFQMIQSSLKKTKKINFF